MKKKSDLTTVEILGAEAVFNKSWEEYCKEQGLGFIKEKFFVTCGNINSESDANGYCLVIEGLNLSHLELMDNHFLIAVCYDEEENRVDFECTYNNGFYRID